MIVIVIQIVYRKPAPTTPLIGVAVTKYVDTFQWLYCTLITYVHRVLESVFKANNFPPELFSLVCGGADVG